MYIIINNIDIIINRNVHNYNFRARDYKFLSNENNKSYLGENNYNIGRFPIAHHPPKNGS